MPPATAMAGAVTQPSTVAAAPAGTSKFETTATGGAATHGPRNGRNTVMSVFGFEPVRISSAERFVREMSLQLERLGADHVICFLSEPRGIVRNFLSGPNVAFAAVPDVWRLKYKPAKLLFRLLRQYRPRILHLSFTGAVSPYPWLARTNGVERVFFTDQGSRPEGFQPRRAEWWRRVTTRLASYPLDTVVCISGYVEQAWKTEDRVDASRLVRIYNSVDLTACEQAHGAEFRRRFHIPADRFLVVQVSWVIPEKGFGDLLAAARAIVKANANVHFAFVGEGECRGEYIRRTAELGLNDHVTWTGPVMNPVDEGVFAAANAVCQVSRWEEAFGWVIAEAMSAGKPVIGTRVGAIPELVSDGRTGFLVERGDSAAIAEHVLRLSRQPELACSMGSLARRVAVEKFDLHANVTRLIELYGLSAAGGKAESSRAAATQRNS